MGPTARFPLLGAHTLSSSSQHSAPGRLAQTGRSLGAPLYRQCRPVPEPPDRSGGPGVRSGRGRFKPFVALGLHSRRRDGLYLFGGSCFILGVVLFATFGAPRILVASLLAALVALAIGTLVTTRTKASVHAGVTAGCAAVLLFVSPLMSPRQPGSAHRGVGESLSAPTYSQPGDSGLGDCSGECRHRLSSPLVVPVWLDSCGNLIS